MSSDRPILVTGHPRSGTSWVGNVISASPEVFQLYEPFNPEAPVSISVPDKFYAMDADAPKTIKHELDEILGLGHVANRILKVPVGVLQGKSKQPNPAGRFVVRRIRDREPFLSPKRVCVKDPIGIYASDWLAKEYDAMGVVMVRHPCAVISSYLALKWDSEYPSFSKYDLAPDAEYLKPKVDAYHRGELSDLDVKILQWQVLAEETLALKERYPNWVFVVHDFLCQAPDEWFAYIFDQLDLPYDKETRAKVLAESSANNSTDPDKHVQHSHARDSRALVNAWQDRLDPKIADQILAEASVTWERVLAALPSRPGLDA